MLSAIIRPTKLVVHVQYIFFSPSFTGDDDDDDDDSYYAGISGIPASIGSAANARTRDGDA